MKRSILLTVVLFLIATGCMQMNMKFHPSADLKSKYDHSSKGRDLTIYYNIKETTNSKVIQMAVQNTGNIYMSNLVINYDECCQQLQSGPGTSKFINLGNLKNRAHKTMDLNIPKKTSGTLKLSYKYTPVREDGFLMSSSSYQASDSAASIRNEVILYID